MNPLLQIKNVKEIINFLNQQHGNLFYAIVERNCGNPLWQIVCQDFDFYMHDRDFRDSMEAIRAKYRKLKFVCCYMVALDNVSVEKLTQRKAWVGKQIIMIK